MLTSTLGGGYQDEDDAMLQMAIRQSMAESNRSGNVAIVRVLNFIVLGV